MIEDLRDDVMVLECRETRLYGESVGTSERMFVFEKCSDMCFLHGSVLYKVVFLVLWSYIAVN